jgi:glyoxylase-like metal-dependent hydrolase (beta-lactamase superfamily II)/ferredoxin
MAHPRRRLATNTAGAFYVDAGCIDCGSCWVWDPLHFAAGELQAHVHRQPRDAAEEEQALLALLACPVAAIGTTPEQLRRIPRDGFPRLIESHRAGAVHYCGWTSRRSYGASSYLVVRPDGRNLLIDSPRFVAPLRRRIEALGGVQAIVLTHRDDVADQQAWASHFGCRRWIHAADADAAPGAEELVWGQDPLAMADDLLLIPTPGHTAGSMVLLLGSQILFGGDHLWWNERRQSLEASRDHCWWDWQAQLASIRRLRDLDVRLLLSGHGGHHRFEPGAWCAAIDRLLG